MSTNGLVLILDGEDIHCKIMAACNGFNAPALAVALAGTGDHPLRQIYDLAIGMHFGCRKCLVVMNSNDACHQLVDELPQKYWDTFWDRMANPMTALPSHSRWWEWVQTVQLNKTVTERMTHG